MPHELRAAPAPALTVGRLRKLAVQAEKSSACKASTTGCYNQTTYDDGRRRRLSRRRLSSCSHGNVGTRPISRSYGLLDDNVFSLAAANGWLPPSDLPTRIPFLSHPAHWDACTHAGAGAHDPDADPAGKHIKT